MFVQIWVLSSSGEGPYHIARSHPTVAAAVPTAEAAPSAQFPAGHVPTAEPALSLTCRSLRATLCSATNILLLPLLTPEALVPCCLSPLRDSTGNFCGPKPGLANFYSKDPVVNILGFVSQSGVYCIFLFFTILLKCKSHS